jgi:O-antigen/teichoic acid export membrane protein
MSVPTEVIAPARPAEAILPSKPGPRPPDGTHFDAHVLAAVRNTAKLGLSLIGTWGVALVVRIMLPRRLGPALFGAFQFADAFTSGLFIFASLGVETYVRKEVATRREHASDFYGGLLMLRLVLSLILVVAAVTILSQAGKAPFVLRLVLILAITQFFVLQNATHAALLHAVGEVGGLSVLNIASKLIWGAGIIIGLMIGDGVQSVAIAMLISEVLKLVGLEVLSRRHLSLRMKLDVPATLAMLAGSLPFFVGGLSQTLYAKINVSVLSFLTTDTEVGWYGAASSVAGMAMLLSPLLSWVLIPLIARAEASSPEDLAALTRKAMALVLSIAIPVTLMLGLGADLIVDTLFGTAFHASILSLRMMAPVFVFTYVGIVSSATLIGQGRGWLVTIVLSSGLLVSPLLNWLFIPRASFALGPGGAGVGAAAALNLTEASIAVALTILLHKATFDRRTFVMLGKTAVVSLGVVALDRIVLQSFGIARLAIDAVAYVVLVVLWKAVDHQALIDLVRRALSSGDRTDVSVA